MKKITAFLFGIMLLLNAAQSFAQEDKSKRPSPPAEARGTIDNAEIAVLYSAPSVKDRVIWGGLVPYGKVWRTGANEATVFETSKAILVNGQPLPAGRYGLFTIPNEKEWVFIFNAVPDQWGAFKYDASKDVLRIMAAPQQCTDFHERMNFKLEGNDVNLYWANLKAGFTVTEDKSQRMSPPAVATASIGNANVTIHYSQPSVRDRKIWGELVPYNKVWRTGANEATTIEIDRDIMIGGKTLPAGKYALFTIPGEKEWTFIINSEWDQWGSGKYDASKDVVRVNAIPVKAPQFHEKLTFDISDNNIVLFWENLMLSIPVKA